MAAWPSPFAHAPQVTVSAPIPATYLKRRAFSRHYSPPGGLADWPGGRMNGLGDVRRRSRARLWCRSGRLLRLTQPGRPGHPDGFETVVHVQFCKDITYVGPYSVGRDHQVLGYLPAAFALHHKQ